MSPFLHRFLQRALTWSGPLLLLFFAAYRCVDWITEHWWFESLGYGAQFNRLFWWRTSSFVLGGAIFAVWLGINARIAWRNAARSSVPLAFFETDDSERLIPLQDKLRFDRYRRHGTIVVVGLLSWFAGLACAARYALFFRALHAGATGITDQASGFDVGLFLFQLPFLNWLSHYCFYAIALSLLLVVTIYLYEELIGPAARVPRVHEAFGRHLAILWGILLIWKALDCLLAIPLSYVSSGNVATRVFDSLDISLGWTSSGLFALATPLFALFSGMAIARHPRVQTFLIGLGWMLGATALPVLLPLMMGHSAKDKSWNDALKRHLESTRRAWGLSEVERLKIHVASSATYREVETKGSGAASLPVALWPASSAMQAMNLRLQSKGANAFVSKVWLESDGQSLFYNGLAFPAAPAQSDWRSWHLRPADSVFLQLDANRAQPDGSPIFRVETKITAPIGNWSPNLAQTSQRVTLETAGLGTEISPAVQDEARWLVGSSQEGTLGVVPDFWNKRLGLAARFFDVGFLRQSWQAHDVILWHRGAADRCRQIAPFIDWQNDARPILLSNGKPSKRLVWIVSGLVWSDDYPDSAAYLTTGKTFQGANYGRETAVGIVDARTGRVSLFALNPDEPFMALYRRVFPNLFAPLTEMSGEIRTYLRPSDAMMTAQAMIWARYHENNVEDWATTKSDWRTLFTPNEPGDTTLRPLLGTGGANWQIMNFAFPGGKVDYLGASPPLTAILGFDQNDFVSRGGMARLVQWQGETSIALPDLAAEPTPDYSTPAATQSSFITVAPRFDGRGQARGLIVAHGLGVVPAEKATSRDTYEGASAPAVPRNSFGGNNFPQQVKLVVRLALSGSGDDLSRILEHSSGKNEQSLERARTAWAKLLAARKAGDWDGVANAEKELNSALGTP